MYYRKTFICSINFMGCYAVFPALKLAKAICESNHQAKVLLVSVELCSIHFQKTNSLDGLISGAIFSDGASAALVENTSFENTFKVSKFADGKKYFALKDFYCDILPHTNDKMTWGIGDQGFDIGLSSYVPELIKSGILELTQNCLKLAELDLNEIRFFAIHPGSKKILQVIEKALGVLPGHSRFSHEVLKNYGNMSSATILFVLKNLLQNVNPDDHQSHIFSCAFGPGLTIESLLLEIHHA